MKITRRKFISGSAAVGALTILPTVSPANTAVRADSYATLLDLNKCDGCSGRPIPLCVQACREGRQDSFPEPSKDQLRDYWPQKKYEDWSSKRHIKDGFTPYNWIFVQQITVNNRVISIPRRCMHCDNPPCAKLCPFGVKHKTPEGPVYIDHNLCFGGAKCRSVCPWSVPQRQAGVGIYTLWQRYIPAGGGVMFKCDLCRERVLSGDTPLCSDACPQKAMLIGRRDEIISEAERLKHIYNGDLYGLSENGGTSTIYVSPIPFKELDEALAAQAEKNGKNPNKVTRLHNPENMLAKQKKWAMLSLVSPIIGFAAAFGLAGRNVDTGGQDQ